MSATLQVPAPEPSLFGSDVLAGLLRSLDIPYIALTPGASFRGLHDSLVNYLGNREPQLLLCVHEEHAVALAHGYARVTGKPLAVALHSNVGLMHATMAIFNAWCDRIPMLLLCGVGPMDAAKRRPWVDWIHTSRDVGSLVRGYTKWDDHPGSVPAAVEAIVRAMRIATTVPCGPVFIGLDAALQEERAPAAGEAPALSAFAQPRAGDPPDDAVAEVAEALSGARAPLLMIGRVSGDEQDFARRVALAERVNARVLTDIKTGASFPTTHRLHPCPPGLYATGAAADLIRDADVIVSLDWIDLAGSLRQAGGGRFPEARVFECSLDQYSHNGWNMDYQALPPTALSLLCPPDRLVARLLDRLPERVTGSAASRASGAPAVADAATRPDGATPSGTATARSAAEAPAERAPDGEPCLSIEALAATVSSTLAPLRPSWIRLPLGWPGEHCRFEHPLDYIGFDGGGGIGSGPGMAVGAALALRGSGRLPVAVLGDGDYLMGVTALWTAVHERVPLLVIVANNQSFFNDELHQERVARMRGRPVENRSVGLRMSNPAMDLAQLARGQGATAFGPVRDAPALAAILADAGARVADGATCVVDVRVAPEYARAVSSALLRQIPGAG
jgi:thiamine pyrophosphate-dependent acetolactate synthase large subunit-like protein